MIIKKLTLRDGEIHYTDKHDAMTPDQLWTSWKNGEIAVFIVLVYQDRHKGYFTPDGDFVQED